MKQKPALCYKGAIEYSTEKRIVRMDELPVSNEEEGERRVSGLECFGEFFSEGAVGTLGTGGSVTFVLFATAFTTRSVVGGGGAAIRRTGRRGALPF